MAYPLRGLRLHRGALGAVLLFLVLATATLLSRGVLIERFFHDIYVPIDTMWRAASGQVPHVDYHTPIGQAYAWPFRLLASIGDVSALTLLHADLLMAGLFLTLSMVALLPRLSPMLVFMAAASVMAMAMAPRDYDNFWYIYSHLAAYNRWGSAACALLALIVLVPRIRPAKWAAHASDGVVVGVLCAFLFYLKVSFLAGALALVGLSLVVRHFQVRTAALAIVIAVAAVAAVELAFHNNRAYLADLAMAASVNRQGAILRLLSLELLQNVAFAAVFVAGLIVMVRNFSPPQALTRSIHDYRKELFLLVGFIGTAIMVHSQNNFSREVPLLAVAPIILAELVWRRGRQADQSTESITDRPRRSRLGFGILLVLGGTSTLFDSMSVVAHSVSTRRADAMRLPALAGTVGAPLMVSRQLLRNFPPYRPQLAPPGGEALLPEGLFQRRARWQAHTALEVRSLTEAMGLLRAEVRPGDVIFSVDFANPYPAFFRLQPPRGSLPWWHLGRSYSPSSHPDLDSLFTSSTLVVQKRVDFYSGPFGAELWSLVGGEVRSRYKPLAQGSIWTLWRRSDAHVPDRTP